MRTGMLRSQRYQTVSAYERSRALQPQVKTTPRGNLICPNQDRDHCAARSLSSSKRAYPNLQMLLITSHKLGDARVPRPTLWDSRSRWPSCDSSVSKLA
jgi:hypothetical protein